MKMMKPEATTSSDVVAKVMGDENLMYEVLKRADGHSLAIAECVCKEWQKIAREETLWAVICMRHLEKIGFRDQQPHSDVILALGSFRRLHSLYLWPLSKLSTYLLSPFPSPFVKPPWCTWLEKAGTSSRKADVLRWTFFDRYYVKLQTEPELVCKYFYNDASTIIRVDGNTRQTATTMVKIETLLVSVTYSGIDIHTRHILESSNGGFLSMISGSFLVDGSGDRRKFIQIFLVLPQQYNMALSSVLNDILQVYV